MYRFDAISSCSWTRYRLETAIFVLVLTIRFAVNILCHISFILHKLPILRKVDIFGYTLYTYVTPIIRNIILLKVSHITYLQIRTQF